VEQLTARAIASRGEYRAEQRAVARYKLEEQAARRLRIPDPQVSAGLKRADVISGILPNPLSNVTSTGVVFSLSVPLPIFNSGRYEVARYRAEQEQAMARAAVLARQIQTDIQGAREVLTIRREALVAYQRELESAGVELTRITRVAYEEGEVGILELLDSLRVNRLASLRLLDLQAGVREAFIELERVVGAELTTNGGWDRFYSFASVWKRSRCTPNLRARLAFVLISKLYRQMYASTGIATDSARRNRASAWARWLAIPCRKLFQSRRVLSWSRPPVQYMRQQIPELALS